jgi:hypothetical protein
MAEGSGARKSTGFGRLWNGIGSNSWRPGMSSSEVEIREARAADVKVTDDSLSAELTDGRTIIVPLAWYPRLLHATPSERNSWRLIGGGRGIHWPEVDEDISVANLLAGQSSGESQSSLKNWLAKRSKAERGE